MFPVPEKSSFVPSLKRTDVRARQFLPLLLLFPLGLFAQNAFLPGTVMPLDGERETEVMIRNQNWTFTPQFVTYRLQSNGETLVGTTDNLTRFSLDRGRRFVRATVELEISPDGRVGQISVDREPEFKERTLFLEVVGDGNLGLYEYRARSMTRYFLRTVDGPIVPLVNKQYSYQNAKRFNRDYLRTLSSEVPVAGIAPDALAEVAYNRASLVAYLERYASERQLGFTAIEDQLRAKARFALLAGGGIHNFRFPDEVNISELVEDPNTGEQSIRMRTVRTDDPRPTSIGFRAAVKGELQLPYNQYAWSLLAGFDGYFGTFSEASSNSSASIDNVSFDVLHPRRYFRVGQSNVRPFVEANLSFILSSSYDFTIRGETFEPGEGLLLVGFGSGVDFGNHFFLSVEYTAARPYQVGVLGMYRF